MPGIVRLVELMPETPVSNRVRLVARYAAVLDEIAPVALPLVLEAQLPVVQPDVAAEESQPRARLVVALHQAEIEQAVDAVRDDAVVLAEQPAVAVRVAQPRARCAGGGIQCPYGANISAARAGANAASIAAAIPVIVSVSRVFMPPSRGQRRKVRSLEMLDGLFVPWMLVWQFRHPRASVDALVLVPVSVPMPAAVARRLVALLAQERRALPEEVRGGRAVRVVADRAVLLHRLVRAHERPALLHVAGVAGVVHVVAHHHRRSYRAVRVVAVGARHHAFAYGMARGPVDLHPLLLVAGEAHVRLGELVAHRVVGDVDLVAGRAGHVVARVRAHLPVDARAALMARRADFVLLRRPHLAEAVRHGIAGALQVLGGIPMAHGAPHADRRPRVGLRSVLACPYRKRVGMTVGADLSVARVVGLGNGAGGINRAPQCETNRQEPTATSCISARHCFPRNASRICFIYSKPRLRRLPAMPAFPPGPHVASVSDRPTEPRAGTAGAAPRHHSAGAV